MPISKKQEPAVYHERGSLLVSAAAGSGKTTTMVAHVMHLLETESIDRFIILTYTRAAAGEMRQRIMSALSERLEKEPGNNHLRQQLFAAGNAYIGTIDSFCMKLVRDHFDRLDLAPDLRIADERELDMMKDEILEQLLQEAYEEGREGFFDLRTDYSTEKSHEDLKTMILHLHQVSQNDPDPEAWLDACRPRYGESARDFPESREGRLAAARIREQVEKALEENAALQAYFQGSGEEIIHRILAGDEEMIRQVLSRPDAETMVAWLNALKFANTPSARNAENPKKNQIDPLDKAVLVQYRKEGYQARLKSLGQHFRGNEAEWQFLKRTEWPMNELIRLTKLFTDRFENACREKNLAGFAAVEHYALQLLTEKKEDGSLGPTELARNLQSRYREVIVDEYQDVNQLQENILLALAGDNLYMVGDVKQSIYSFRRAKPSIFVDKYLSYEDDPLSLTRRLDLGENYRSHPFILEGANELFEAVMTASAGGVDYDEKARLYAPEAYEYPGGGCPPRAVLVEMPEDDIRERTRGEARYVAGEIRRLLESGEEIFDGKLKRKRALTPRDFVILLRGLKRAQIYADALKSFGIPATFPRKKGFYEQQEVKWMLSLLSLADNPRQDVPLAALMLSPLEGFSPDDLATLRGREADLRSRDLWGRLLAGREDPRIDALLETIGQWRRRAAYMPLRDFVLDLYRDSGLEAYLKAHPEEGHYANIRLLADLAREFEEGYGRGLYQFLHFLDRQKKLSVEDRGEAEHLPAGIQAVEINTIHSSKGLEYPVVFLAETAKDFNDQDLKKPYLSDEKEGVALYTKDAEHYIRTTNLFYDRIKEKKRRDNLSEEIRLFYVAMTRARERFYLVGALKDPEAEAEARKLLNPPLAGPMPEEAITKQKNYMGLYLLAAANRRMPHFPMERIRSIDLPDPAAFRSKPPAWEADQAAAESREAEACRPWEHLIPAPYGYPSAEGMKAVYSVSELKEKPDQPSQGEEEQSPYPAWLTGKQVDGKTFREVPSDAAGTMEEAALISAGERGTAYHKALEHLPWEEGADPVRVAHYLEDMEKRSILSPEDRKSIEPAQLTAFFTEPEGQRSLQAFRAGKLWREQPFMMGIPYNQLNPSFSGTETVLVQGIIDLFFEEDGKLILVDYKTDRHVTPEVLRERHAAQLAYYARALETARNQPVAEIYIYSFFLKKFVAVELS